MQAHNRNALRNCYLIIIRNSSFVILKGRAAAPKRAQRRAIRGANVGTRHALSLQRPYYPSRKIRQAQRKGRSAFFVYLPLQKKSLFTFHFSLFTFHCRHYRQV